SHCPPLKTSRTPASPLSRNSSYKSLFSNTLHITPLNRILCADSQNIYSVLNILQKEGGGGVPPISGQVLGVRSQGDQRLPLWTITRRLEINCRAVPAKSEQLIADFRGASTHAC